MQKEPNRASQIYAIVLAVIGWFALVLQFYLLIVHSLAKNITVPTAIINYFSYFTILTNLLVAASLTWPLVNPANIGGKFFALPTIKSAIALYILVVGIVYSVALRKIRILEGWDWVANELLHDIIPTAYFIFWLVFVPKGLLVWKDAFSWLAFPLVYLFYTLIRGVFTNIYPYPFINVNKLGYSQILVNIGVLSLVFFVLGLLLIGINRSLKRFF